MPQDLSNLQYIFVVVAALTHSGVQAEHEPVRFDHQSDSKFVVSYRIVFKQVEVSTILASVESSGSWLHANTCPVFVR